MTKSLGYFLSVLVFGAMALPAKAQMSANTPKDGLRRPLSLPESKNAPVSHARTATLTFEGTNGQADLTAQSYMLQTRVDLRSHYFGLLGKLGTFLAPSDNEDKTFNTLIDADHHTLEFRPDNPNVKLVPLKPGQSVEVKVAGQMRFAGMLAPISIPFTMSRDTEGNYHLDGMVVFNLATFQLKVPEELASKYTGVVRLAFKN